MRKHAALGGLALSCLAVLLAVGMAVTLTACGGGDSIKLSDSVPSGFRSRKVDDMRLAYPDTWEAKASSGSLDADSPDGGASLSVLHCRASTIEDMPSLDIYKGKSLDHDVDKEVESAHAKGAKVKRVAKGSDGPAAIYRYEVSGKTEAGDTVHGYWQYTFSGKGYYIVMVTASKKDFGSHKDQMLDVLNSQKLSHPKKPQRLDD